MSSIKNLNIASIIDIKNNIHTLTSSILGRVIPLNITQSVTFNIKQFIMDNLYDKQRKVLLRNTNDRKVDISVLGAIYPFGVFEKNDVVVKNTIEQINMTLRTYLGGYLRFQDDTYMGGKNPWIISTAWMGMYYKKIRDKKEAQECLNFIVKSATNLGLLSEQTSSNLTDRWVVGLAWSHAMFIGLLAN